MEAQLSQQLISNMTTGKQTNRPNLEFTRDAIEPDKLLLSKNSTNNADDVHILVKSNHKDEVSPSRQWD